MAAIPEVWQMRIPKEENEFSLFDEALEIDPLVLFHATPMRNRDSIISNGFLTSIELQTGQDNWVSFSTRRKGRPDVSGRH